MNEVEEHRQRAATSAPDQDKLFTMMQQDIAASHENGLTLVTRKHCNFDSCSLYETHLMGRDRQGWYHIDYVIATKGQE